MGNIVLILVSLTLFGRSYSQLEINAQNVASDFLRDALFKEISAWKENDISETVPINNRPTLPPKPNTAKYKCRLQLLTMYKRWKQKDVFPFFDSWGKVPSGLMYGHLKDLGNYDQCINHHLNLGTILGEFDGKYCLARMPIMQFLPTTKLLRDMNNNLMGRSAGPETTNMTFGTDLALAIAICIPSNCKPDHVAEILSTALNNTKVSLRNCSVKEKPSFYPMDWFGIVFYSLVGIIMILSSAYEYITCLLNKKQIPLLMAWSIKSNSSKLFNMTVTKNPNSIGCLGGIRVISMCWVVFSHEYMYSVTASLLNPVEAIKWVRLTYAMVVLTAVIAVDTFFFLSGFLVTWIGLKEMDKSNGKINILKMYVHRILRISPPVAVLIIFCAGLIKYFGVGPFSPALISTKPCRKYWWITMLYITNYSKHGVCLPHTWYISVDMQMYVFAPFLLYGLYKWGNKFIPVIMVLMALSVGCLFASFYKYHITQVITVLDTTPMRTSKLYLGTHVRYPIWLVGVLFGYFLHTCKKKEFKLPKIAVLIAWALAISILFSVVFGPHHTTLNKYKATTFESASYESFSKISWGVALSIIIFLCHNGFGGIINDFLSHALWQPFAKLSFSIYLIHFCIVQPIKYGSFRTDLNFSDFEMILQFWPTFAISTLLAVVLVLAVESPVIALEKIIFSKKSVKPKERRAEESLESKPSENNNEKELA